MSIARKLFLGYIGPSIFLVVIGIIATASMNFVSSNQDLVTHTWQVLDDVTTLDADVLRAQSAVRGYVLLGDESLLSGYADASADLKFRLDDLGRLVSDNPRQVDRIEGRGGPGLRRLLAERVKSLDTTVDAFRTRGLDGARAAMRQTSGQQLTNDIVGILSAMKQEEQNLLQQRYTEALRARNQALLAIWAGTLLLGLVGATQGRRLSNSLTDAIDTMLAGTRRIGEGDLSQPIKVQSEDELGQLAAALNVMTENLKTSMVSAETERKARERVENLMNVIQDVVSQLSATTSELVAAATQQSSGGQEQTAAVSETVAIIDQVTQTSDQSAQRARTVAASSQRADEVGRAGRKAVDETVLVMQSVKEQTDSVAEIINGLAEQAHAIGEIVASVNDIAEQTNLLALNAAIEASRAGEHGRGFAVVAGEVKNLAEQSKKATGQVRQILGEIQRATNAAVTATDENNRSVAGAMRVVVGAGETIRDLSSTVDQTAQAASQIVASAGQQATGMLQIHQAMKNIQQVTTQTLASSQQTERAAQDLNRLGGRLRDLLQSRG